MAGYRYALQVHRTRGRRAGYYTNGRPGWAPLTPALAGRLLRGWGKPRWANTAVYTTRKPLALVAARWWAAMLGRRVRVVGYQCGYCGCPQCC